MSGPSGIFPIFAGDSALRILPTEIYQFIRLGQCERDLRFRLAERDGQKFMRDYDVARDARAMVRNPPRD